MEFRDIKDNVPAESASDAPGEKRLRNIPVFRNKISLRLAGGLVVLICLIICVSFLVIWFSGRPLLGQ